jgi:hypothetical protein
MSSGGMLLDGERTSGQDIRTQNVTAAMAIANIVKTSLGPVGLDKMLVDEIGDVTITNDGATILAQLDIEHPAAKVIILFCSYYFFCYIFISVFSSNIFIVVIIYFNTRK